MCGAGIMGVGARLLLGSGKDSFQDAVFGFHLARCGWTCSTAVDRLLLPRSYLHSKHQERLPGPHMERRQILASPLFSRQPSHVHKHHTKC
jgi:hypothetical protein